MRSEVASKIYNETPESIKSDVREMANAIVFDANTFGPDEVPVEQDHGYSADVLIDCDGERKYFTTGWYDHHYRKWISNTEEYTITDNMRWLFLPLAIYDTNPELRKTIKRT